MRDSTERVRTYCNTGTLLYCNICAARRPVHVYCTTCDAPGQGGHLSGSTNCTYAGNQVGTACALIKAWPLAAVALMRAEGASARSALTNAVAAAELLGGTGKLPGRPRQGGVSYVPLRIAANLPGTYVHVRTCTHAHARTHTHVRKQAHRHKAKAEESHRK